MRVAAVEASERAHGLDGAWSRLFAHDQGHRGTATLESARDEYARIDRECQALTESERELGAFAVVVE